MGHSLEERKLEVAAEPMRHWERVNSLFNQLKHVRLSEFTVGEMPALARLAGVHPDPTGSTRLTEEDFKILEAKCRK